MHEFRDFLVAFLIWGCVQKFPDWPPGARIANGTALCHYVHLYRYFVSQSSEFCFHNPLCCFLMRVYCCCFFFFFVIDSVQKLLVTPLYPLYYFKGISVLYVCDDHLFWFKSTPFIVPISMADKQVYNIDYMFGMFEKWKRIHYICWRKGSQVHGLN
jgi:hypothetical protein